MPIGSEARPLSSIEPGSRKSRVANRPSAERSSAGAASLSRPSKRKRPFGSTRAESTSDVQRFVSRSTPSAPSTEPLSR